MSKNIKYGIHTAVLKHVVSYRESMQIKRELGYALGDKVSKNTTFFSYGIDELSIRETLKKYPSNTVGSENYIESKIYELELIINFSKAIGGNENLVMELTSKNIKKLRAALNAVLSKQLKLGIINNDISSWSFERLDDAFDIYLDIKPGNYIYLLNESLVLPPNKRLEEFHKEDLGLGTQRAYESVYFGNGSFTMNIYDKWNEQKKKKPEITEADPTFRLLRAERQNEQQYIKNFLPKRMFEELFDGRNIDTMRQSLKKHIKKYFGTGNYYEDSLIYDLVSDEYDHIDEKYRFLLNRSVVNGGRLLNHQNIDSELASKFDEFGIAPAYIDFCTNSFWSIEDVDGNKYAWYPGLYNLIDIHYPDIKIRKKYNAYSIPKKDAKNNRYKVHFIVHDVLGNKGNDYYSSGKDFDECQKRMFAKLFFASPFWKKLQSVLGQNCMSILDKVARVPAPFRCRKSIAGLLL